MLITYTKLLLVLFLRFFLFVNEKLMMFILSYL